MHICRTIKNNYKYFYSPIAKLKINTCVSFLVFKIVQNFKWLLGVFNFSTHSLWVEWSYLVCVIFIMCVCVSVCLSVCVWGGVLSRCGCMFECVIPIRNRIKCIPNVLLLLSLLCWWWECRKQKSLRLWLTESIYSERMNVQSCNAWEAGNSSL